MANISVYKCVVTLVKFLRHKCFSNVCRKNLQVPINTFNEMQEEIKVECMWLFSLYVILNYF